MGRPSKYSKDLADKICSLLATGKSLRSICLEEDMPHESTVRSWVVDDLHGFSTQYTRSRDLGLDAMADEMLDIADDGTNDFVERQKKNGETYIALDKEAVMRSRLRFDARQWYLSKMAPKRYAQKTFSELTGKDGAALNPASVSDDQLTAALNALMHNTPAEHTQPFEDERDDSDASDLV